MIVRLYKAKIKPGKEDEFQRIVERVALPMLRKHRGLVDAFYTWDTWGERREFAFVSVWKTLAAVKKFAGEDWDKPVIPEEEKPLIESCRVEHYEPLGSTE